MGLYRKRQHNLLIGERSGDNNDHKALIILEDKDSTKIKSKLNIDGLNINLSFTQNKLHKDY